MDRALDQTLDRSLTSAPIRALEDGFRAMVARSRTDPAPDCAERLDRLARLRAVVADNEERFRQAISADFGHRSAVETTIAETMLVFSEIRHATKHLKSWMAPQRVATALQFLPARNRLIPQPLGQVGRRLGARPRDHGLEGILQRREWRARQGVVQGMVHGWSPLKMAFAPGFIARKLGLCGTSGKSAPNGPEIGPTHCHKVEKNVPTALSKGSPGWYIRLAPEGLCPGVAFQGSLWDARASHANSAGPHSSSPAFRRRRAKV